MPAFSVLVLFSLWLFHPKHWCIQFFFYLLYISIHEKVCVLHFTIFFRGMGDWAEHNWNLV